VLVLSKFTLTEPRIKVASSLWPTKLSASAVDIHHSVLLAALYKDTRFMKP
jgi:hypothetical protein